MRRDREELLFGVACGFNIGGWVVMAVALSEPGTLIFAVAGAALLGRRIGGS